MSPPEKPLIIELQQIDSVWGLCIIQGCPVILHHQACLIDFKALEKNQAIIFITCIQTWDLTSSMQLPLCVAMICVYVYFL